MSAAVQQMLMAMGVVPTTYATWNPSDKGSGCTLSNGNLTVSASGYSNSGVRATIGKSTGKWYWELTVVSGSYNLASVGPNTWSLAASAMSGCWGYLQATGDAYNNSNGGVTYGATWTTAGDVIGVALDMTNGTVTMYKNGSSQGTMASGLSGTFYPTWSTGNNAASLTANFGASAFAYSVPSGYNSGVY